MAYSYRRAVTIDHTKVPNTDQSSFPLLFSGTYAYLATVANGGNVTSASGFDIIFTSDAAGATKLDHEIESYAPTTGAVNFWVRIPTLSHTTDTVIYLWYSDSAITTSQENVAGVWDANFKRVHHMADNAATTVVKDSKAILNGVNAANTNTKTTTGKIGNALNYAGSTDETSLGDLGLTAGTVEFWVKPTDINYNRRLLSQASGAGTQGGALGLDNPSTASDGLIWVWDGTVWQQLATSALAVGTNISIAVVYAGGNATLYFNGAVQNTKATAFAFSGVVCKIAGLFVGSFGTRFNGVFDEVRISNASRSANWIAATYNSQFSPSTFYAVGEALDLPPGSALLAVTMAGVLTTTIALAATAALAITSSGGLTTAIHMAATALLTVTAAPELTTRVPVGWLVSRGAGPWGFTPQPDTFGYINNPRWTKAPASLVEHQPCGYWWKCR